MPLSLTYRNESNVVADIFKWNTHAIFWRGWHAFFHAALLRPYSCHTTVCNQLSLASPTISKVLVAISPAPVIFLIQISLLLSSDVFKFHDWGISAVVHMGWAAYIAIFRIWSSLHFFLDNPDFSTVTRLKRTQTLLSCYKAVDWNDTELDIPCFCTSLIKWLAALILCIEQVQLLFFCKPHAVCFCWRCPRLLVHCW